VAEEARFKFYLMSGFRDAEAPRYPGENRINQSPAPWGLAPGTLDSQLPRFENSFLESFLLVLFNSVCPVDVDVASENAIVGINSLSIHEDLHQNAVTHSPIHGKLGPPSSSKDVSTC